MQQTTSVLIPVSRDGEVDPTNEAGQQQLNMLLNAGWVVLASSSVVTTRQVMWLLLLVRGEPLPYPGTGSGKADSKG